MPRVTTRLPSRASSPARMTLQVLRPADLSKFYHLIGNCYVKSNDPRSAAEYYLKALTGSPEKRKPSLYVNLGTALLGTKVTRTRSRHSGCALDLSHLLDAL